MVSRTHKLSIFSNGSLSDEPEGRIFRFLKDQEFGPVRPMGNDSTPATVRLFINPQTSGALTLSQTEANYVQSINTAASFQYLKASLGGWVNQGEWPFIQLIGFQDNYFRGRSIGEWTEVFTHRHNVPMIPDELKENWWFNIHQDGVFTPGKNYADQAKIILISLTGILYVQSYKVIEVP